MSMMKIQPTGQSVDDYLATVVHDGRREDAIALKAMMDRVTGATARMWGGSMVGYGNYQYRRADGSQHSFLMTGFSPREANLVVYLLTGVDKHSDQLARLGKHTHSVSCLYLGRLDSVDQAVLERMIADDFAAMKQAYPDHTL